MKPILDATCGGRMMWFDKHNPSVLYLDHREIKDVELCDGRRFSVEPDILADFTALPFSNDTFYLVVFDPPHLIHAGDNSYLKTKYGRLEGDWEETIRKGFSECIRVLRPGGTLIFKWNKCQIPVRTILQMAPVPPLFGHRSGKANKTHWITFMKPLTI